MSQNDVVERWLDRLSPSTADNYRFLFGGWMSWMQKGQGKLAQLSPDGLVEFQRTHRDYQILDFVQEYVGQMEGRVNYKRKIYTTIRSFFLHNRVALPKDPSFHILGTKEKVVGSLNVEDFVSFLNSCNRMYRALFLCMFQGGMDVQGLLYWNENGYASLMKGLRAKINPIRIDLPGRKMARFERPYYTFIGTDAIEALENYLQTRSDRIDNIFLTNFGTSIKYPTLHSYWMRNMKRIGLIRKTSDSKSNRYGKNPHELRDLFRTRWQKSGRVPEAAEFFLGHQVDPLEYNKAFRDERYASGEYRKAMKWLNIISEDPEHIHIDEVEEKVNKDIEDLWQALETQGKLIQRLMEREKH